jgi:chemotaxis protein CheC
MTIAQLSPEHSDALQEVVNIAMGQAGDNLARLLDTFVSLSIPQIRMVELDDIMDVLHQMVGRENRVSAIRQAFFPRLRGEAIVLFPEHRMQGVAMLMGYNVAPNPQQQQEIQLDITNILVGSILSGITQTLGTDLRFSPPSLLASDVPVERVIDTGNVEWRHVLLVEVNFSLNEHSFRSHMLLLMAEEALVPLREVLDDLMEAL